jgi:hypothetical protein
MPDYRIFVLKNGRIKEPAKIISCPDDEAATEQARQLLDGTDQSLEVWQSDRARHLAGNMQPSHHATRPVDACCYRVQAEHSDGYQTVASCRWGPGTNP